MINKNIVFGLLARDCAENLKCNITRIEETGAHFSDYHVLIYENDSKDGTTEVLQAWAERNSHVVAICEKTNQVTIPQKTAKMPHPAKSPYRIEKMARFRNRVLDEVKKRFCPDYFCFIDVDIQEFQPESLIKAISDAPEDWGALFANGHLMFVNSDGTQFPAPFQYDSYAFVQEGVDYMATGNWCIQHNFHKITAWTVEEGVRQHGYLPCTSAFNGIGIYKWNAIKNLTYTVEQTEELKAKNCCFCEHVPFNSKIVSKGYRNYIVHDLTVIYRGKKNTAMRCFNRWKERLKVKFLLRFCGPYPIKPYSV